MKFYKRLDVGPNYTHVEAYVEASPEDVVAAFRELPQTTQMRAAADVLVDATDRHFHIRGAAEYQDWRPANLRMMATRWDREDAEKAKQATEIEELARALHDLADPDVSFDETGSHIVTCYRERAEKLFAAGYRKVADDE